MPQSIDDRLYVLQNTPELPDDLKKKLHEADVAYLQDRDGECLRLLDEIENQCRKLGINLWNPNAPA